MTKMAIDIDCEPGSAHCSGCDLLGDCQHEDSDGNPTGAHQYICGHDGTPIDTDSGLVPLRTPDCLAAEIRDTERAPADFLAITAALEEVIAEMCEDRRVPIGHVRRLRAVVTAVGAMETKHALDSPGCIGAEIAESSKYDDPEDSCEDDEGPSASDPHAASRWLDDGGREPEMVLVARYEPEDE